MSTANESPRTRRYAADAGLSAVARIAPLAVQLLVTPFVIAAVGPHAYAVWALLATTINLLLTADLGVVGIMQRYHGIALGRNDPAMGARVTATVLAVLALLLVLVTILGPEIADLALAVVRVAPEVRGSARLLFRNAGTLAVLQLIGLAFSSYLAAHRRFVAMAIVSLGARLLSATTITIALALSWKLPGLLFAGYVDAIAAIVLGLVFCRSHLLREVRRLVNRLEARELWSYAWRNQASALGFVIQRESDVLLAAILLSATVQATIASSAQLAAALSLAPTVLLVPLFSQLSTLAGHSRSAAVAQLHSAESNWFGFVLPFAGVMIATAPFLAAAWLGPALPEVPLIMAVLSAGFLVTLANSVRAVLVRSIGLPGVETVSYVAIIVTKVALGVPAALLWGGVGLAASTLIAAVIGVIAMWTISRRAVPGLRAGLPNRRGVLAFAFSVAVGTPLAYLLFRLQLSRVVELIVLVALAAVIAIGSATIAVGRSALISWTLRRS